MSEKNNIKEKYKQLYAEEEAAKRMATILEYEEIDLPSKGLLYPREHPLSCGKVRLKYPTTKEEDILLNPNYAKKNSSIEMFLRATIICTGEGKIVNYDDLILGDKNWIMVKARILLYGPDYLVTVQTSDSEPKSITISLADVKCKELDVNDLIEPHRNEYEFKSQLGRTITFKSLTAGDERAVTRKLDDTQIVSQRLRLSITSIDGETDPTKLDALVDNMRSIESRALRARINEVVPDVIMETTVELEEGNPQVAKIPFTSQFFWPN